jgi:hypothetical protein
MSALGLSYSDNFEGYYKIAGFSVNRNLNKQVIQRSVYDFLNFLGDVGGLDGIMLLLGALLVSFVTGFFQTSFYMAGLY